MNQITPETTAERCYTERQEAILNLLDQLRNDVAAHSRDFEKAGGRNWCYPSELGDILHTLQQAHNFLNNIEE